VAEGEDSPAKKKQKKEMVEESEPKPQQAHPQATVAATAPATATCAFTGPAFGRHWLEATKRGKWKQWETPVGRWDDPANNPHAAQTLLNRPELGYEAHAGMPFTRVVDDAIVRCMPYRRRAGEEKTVVHWGQRKLLMSEIEFLTLHGRDATTVVYAGAAPGTHINYLAGLFPELHWVLVDPAPFTCHPSPSIEVRQELFTDDMAREFAAEGRPPMLFISDVRSVDWMKATDEAEVEARVAADMAMQQRWVELMRPVWSMLKFRLPWPPGKTPYLDGSIFLPVWGPITTTECRLVVPGGAPIREYDNTKHEQQMFFFNTTLRPALYPHDVSGVGIDHCYDCRAEVHILSQYIAQRVQLRPGERLEERVSRMSREISSRLSAVRTLASPNAEPGERKAAIVRRQYIGGIPAYDFAKQHPQQHHRHGGRTNKGDSDDEAALLRSIKRKKLVVGTVH